MYIIARTAAKRPTLQHKLANGLMLMTLCGLDTRNWSRAYQQQPITQILCKKCEAHRG